MVFAARGLQIRRVSTFAVSSGNNHRGSFGSWGTHRVLETHRPPNKVPTLWLDASPVRSLSTYISELPLCVSCTSTVQARGEGLLINTHRFCPAHARASSPAGHRPVSKMTSVTSKLCSSGTNAHSISLSVSSGSAYSSNQDSVISVPFPEHVHAHARNHESSTGRPLDSHTSVRL